MDIEIRDKPFDIYIGSRAGEKLLNDIAAAERRIRIMSPYVSPREMQLLRDRAEQNCQVDCIATVDLQQFDWRQSETARNVIAQERTARPVVRAVFRSLATIAALLAAVAIVALVMLFVRLELLLEVEAIQPLWVSIPGAIAGAIVTYSIARALPVYRHRYTRLFPVKFLVKQSTGTGGGEQSGGGRADPTPFHHVKLYIIDERITYLGSLNFTDAGLQANVESRLRSTDSELAQQLSGYFDRVLATYPEADVEWLGKRVYDEPRNTLAK